MFHFLIWTSAWNSLHFFSFKVYFVPYVLNTVILLPAHPTSFAHNFVSGMQSFLFKRVPGCNSIADLSLKIVFWTHKFAVGLIDMGNSEPQDP